MKKLFLVLAVALMSVSTPTLAGTKTCSETTTCESAFTIPMNIILRQTIYFNDGTSITLYYQKENDECRLYSMTDITKYTEKDLERVKSTSIDIVDKTKGKCYVTMKTKDVLSLAKKVFKRVAD